MFCRQCEQTFRWKACEDNGVCGKSPEVSDLQDLLIHALEGLAVYGHKARALGVRDPETDVFLMNAVFMTLTNVNFDAEPVASTIREAVRRREALKKLFLEAYTKTHGTTFAEPLPAVTDWIPSESPEELRRQAQRVSLRILSPENEDIQSLKEILLYGLKGMAAYAAHAARLGETDEEVTAFLYKGLAALPDASLDADALFELVLQCGKANLTCLEILDRGHHTRFGVPTPTSVTIGVKKGPAIIVSGHDLEDLADLLEQTQGTGVRIYTHGEMLPGLAYPELKKHPHLAGHFGTAWQNQQSEFDRIPAAILMTTNCLMEPRESYRDRIFTTGAVGWPGVTHIPERNGNKDFRPVIEKALELGGFPADHKEDEILIGFAHESILGAAEKIVTAVKEGKIRRFFLIGGCDGARPGRNYFTEFAEKVPSDCIVLTLGCGKNRLNRLKLGEVAGLPRLLDCGQCNDAYSAIVTAQALSQAFACGINDLPLSLIISWYEQKAVAVLLTLLHLGVKNIRLGPSLPAFVSPNVLKILVDKFGIQPIRTVDEDLREALGETEAATA